MSGQRVSPAADIHALGVLFDRLFANRPPLLWRVLIRRMTSSIPTLRPQSVAAVRRALLVIRFSSIFSALAIGALAVVCVTLTGQLLSSKPQPEWTPLAPEYVETVWVTTNGVRDCYWHIRLPDNGNYTRGDLIRPPYAQYDRKTDSTTYRRSRLVIQGPGRFYAPHIAGADVHLISNVTLVTSSAPPTNDHFKSFFPQPIPVDPDNTSMLFPRFTIDPGSTVQKHDQLPRE